MSILTIICLCCIFYAYLGYPLVLKFLCLVGISNKKLVFALTGEYPNISIIITAHNEEKAIATKLDNTLTLSYPKPFQVIVASDGSTDRTNEIVKKYEAQGIVLVTLNSHSGKGAAQKAALEQAIGEVIVFTDAKVILDQNALLNFAKYFSIAEIGAVSSKDVVVDEPQKAMLSSPVQQSNEGLYVRYEMWLRKLESEFNSVIGLSGSCFAIRKHVAKDIKGEMSEDFSLLLNTVKLGMRGVHAQDAVHYYGFVKSEEEEFHRKVRTVLRGITTFFAHLEVLDPRRFGLFSWQIISHKLFRWLVPWFGIIALLAALLSMSSSVISCLFAIAVFFLFIFLLVASTVPKVRCLRISNLLRFLIISNMAIFLAWIKYISGARQGLWKPSNKSNATN